MSQRDYPSFEGRTELTADLVNALIEDVRRASQLVAPPPLEVVRTAGGGALRLLSPPGVWLRLTEPLGGGHYGWTAQRPVPGGRGEMEDDPLALAGERGLPARELNGATDVPAGVLVWAEKRLAEGAGGASLYFFRAPLREGRSPDLWFWAQLSGEENGTYGYQEVEYRDGDFSERSGGRRGTAGTSEALTEASGATGIAEGTIVLVHGWRGSAATGSGLVRDQLTFAGVGSGAGGPSGTWGRILGADTASGEAGLYRWVTLSHAPSGRLQPASEEETTPLREINAEANVPAGSIVWAVSQGEERLFRFDGQGGFWARLTGSGSDAVYPFERVIPGTADTVSEPSLDEEEEASPTDYPEDYGDSLFVGDEVFTQPDNQLAGWTPLEIEGVVVTGLATEANGVQSLDPGVVVWVYLVQEGEEPVLRFFAPEQALWAVTTGSKEDGYPWIELDPPTDLATGLPRAPRTGTATDLSGSADWPVGTRLRLRRENLPGGEWRFRNDALPTVSLFRYLGGGEGVMLGSGGEEMATFGLSGGGPAGLLVGSYYVGERVGDIYQIPSILPEADLSHWGILRAGVQDLGAKSIPDGLWVTGEDLSGPGLTTNGFQLSDTLKIEQDGSAARLRGGVFSYSRWTDLFENVPHYEDGITGEYTLAVLPDVNLELTFAGGLLVSGEVTGDNLAWTGTFLADGAGIDPGSGLPYPKTRVHVAQGIIVRLEALP